MTISYNWLCEYLPVAVTPERLSIILTSLGLEVESFEKFESVKGGLKGLVVGAVLECEKHPAADKLSLTKVDIGKEAPLQIVCGAPNVAVGQKVIVAPVGTTIYPVSGDPLTMKVAKIRGVESYGMICAEDEVGLGSSHNGIMVLPAETKVGESVANLFNIQADWVYEIGLTPNRMDAMSHLGVAKDVTAYLTIHDGITGSVKYPYATGFSADNAHLNIAVKIENQQACQRYCGVSISNVTIKESPAWLQQRLTAIGLKPINNIVDITNFILHETGQPLHAFDAGKIKGNKVLVKNLPQGTAFITLDGKERKLDAEDLVICNADSEPMCIGGVFGGLQSGVTKDTKSIFLESAWFNPITIRKTSFKHNLRTDAAARFEKGVDISNTAVVLQRAALLIKEIAGGEISSSLIDVYPAPQPKKQVELKYAYLKRLSGKQYPADTVLKVLQSSGFDVLQQSGEAVTVAAPYSKPDIELPADVVEEIMRIDGYDNVAIPQHINISPSVETIGFATALKEKTGNFLAANGFNEIFTNSITNSAYFDDDTLQHTVKMLNSLSADLNVMRPSMLETGLECVLHNLNHKNNNIRLFEFGKTYKTEAPGKYSEKDNLCFYITGALKEGSWNTKEQKSDFYYLKGLIESVFQLAAINKYAFENSSQSYLQYGLDIVIKKQPVGSIGLVNASVAKRFDIKSPVWYAVLDWQKITEIAGAQLQGYVEIPKFPAVQRDIAIVIDKNIQYREVEKVVNKLGIQRLQGLKLFDVFESDKLGASKKSLAVNFTFLDKEKTMTDTDIDGMIQKIMQAFEKELSAEIRK